jgi:hypothetical protein
MDKAEETYIESCALKYPASDAASIGRFGPKVPCRKYILWRSGSTAASCNSGCPNTLFVPSLQMGLSDVAHLPRPLQLLNLNEPIRVAQLKLPVTA